MPFNSSRRARDRRTNYHRQPMNNRDDETTNVISKITKQSAAQHTTAQSDAAQQCNEKHGRAVLASSRDRSERFMNDVSWISTRRYAWLLSHLCSIHILQYIIYLPPAGVAPPRLLHSILYCLAPRSCGRPSRPYSS